MTDTVCTLFELRAGDDTVNEGKIDKPCLIEQQQLQDEKMQWCILRLVNNIR